MLVPALMAVTACGDAEEPAPLAGGEASDPLPNATMSPLAESDGPAPTLSLDALGDDLEADLGPTLGACAFAHDGETLMIAGAPDESGSRGRGVVQIAGVERLMTGERTGGPDYINAGPVMTDGDFTVEVRRGAGEGNPVGIESTRWPAELAIQQGMGAERVYRPGTWTCGV